MNAFREVSGAQEDKKCIIVNAQRFLSSLTPQAHGNSYDDLEQAKGRSYRKVVTSAAEADAIATVSVAVRNAPDVLRNMLWREKLETALYENLKVIVPNKQSLKKIALWKQKTTQVGSKHSHAED